MESMGDILNDNERFKKSSSNDIDNDIGKKIDDEEAERRASYIDSKLNAPNSRKYFLKVSYKLPDRIVDNCLETALEKGRDPLRLFIHLTEREIRRLYGRK